MPLEKAKCEELCVRAYGNHKQIKQGFWEVILIDLSMKEQLGGGLEHLWNEMKVHMPGMKDNESFA